MAEFIAAEEAEEKAAAASLVAASDAKVKNRKQVAKKTKSK